MLAHEALGLRDISRSDLIVDDAGPVWFLEVNVAPGMTETSTVPLVRRPPAWTSASSGATSSTPRWRDARP